MNELQAAASALTSLKTAYDIAKTMIGLRDANVVREKALELNEALFAAREDSLKAQATQTTLTQRIGELEKEVADLKAWDREKERYVLSEIGPGVLAYAVKADAQGSEPFHLLCPRCYQDRKKSILQFEGDYWGVAHFKCHSCSSEIKVAIKQPRFPFKEIQERSGQY